MMQKRAASCSSSGPAAPSGAVRWIPPPRCATLPLVAGMDLSYYLTSLGVIPIFAFRAFVPLFATALVARFGMEWAPLAGLAGIELLSGLPDWASDDTTLLVLGGMSALEVLLTKVPETRDLITYTETQRKAIAAFLVCFLMVQGDPRELLDHLRKEGLSTDYAWGQSFAYSWSFAIGSCVWLASTLRRSVHRLLMELDEDDAIGLQRLISWMEDGIGFAGVLVVLVFPLLSLLLAGMALLGLWSVRRYLEAREEQQKAPCGSCGTRNHLSAIRCSGCGVSLPQPHRVGILGVARLGVVADIDAHRLALVANKRCPSCAERLKEKRLDQRCPACGAAPFPDEAARGAYLAGLRARLPRTLAICLGLGAIPLLGLVPGILYYRLSLIASLRYYIPRTVGMLTRWLVRILNLFLLALQPVPLLGAVTLPLMCAMNFAVYGAAFARQPLGRDPGGVGSGTSGPSRALSR